MTTGDVVYSLRFSPIKILPEPGFDLGSTAGEASVLTARLHIMTTLNELPGPWTALQEYGIHCPPYPVQHTLSNIPCPTYPVQHTLCPRHAKCYIRRLR